MNDHEFIISIRDQCNAQLTGVQPPVEPPVGQPPSQPPTPGTPPAANFNLGWSEGAPLFVQNASQTYSVTPSAEWLAKAASDAAYLKQHGAFERGYTPAQLSLSGGYNSGAGVTPPHIVYTIGGNSLEFTGDRQNWTYNPAFPNGFPMPTGAFTVTVVQLDAERNPVGAPYGVAIQLNHAP